MITVLTSPLRFQILFDIQFWHTSLYSLPGFLINTEYLTKQSQLSVSYVMLLFILPTSL